MRTESFYRNIPKKGRLPSAAERKLLEHCEATVKKVLEKIDGVASADVSHKEGTAVVTLSGDVADDKLKEAVEDRDYKVISIA